MKNIAISNIQFILNCKNEIHRIFQTLSLIKY